MTTLRRTSCPACGCSTYSSGQTDPQTPPDVFWARCDMCGLLWSREVGLEIGHMTFEKSGGVLEDRPYDPSLDKIKRVLGGDVEPWRNLYRRIMERIPPGTGRNVFLDVGFGGGEVMECARADWGRVAGTEIGTDFVLFAKERGLEAHYVDAAVDPVVPGLAGACDLVVANEVMEHTLDPLAFLQGVARYMAPNGYFWATFCRSEASESIHHGEWCYWTQAAVATLLQRAGLEIVSLELYAANIWVTARLRQQVPQYAARDAGGAAFLAAEQGS